MPVPIQCWTIVYGSYLSENETLTFLAPTLITDIWRRGLDQVVSEVRKQCQAPDRRLFHLKKLYVDLFFDSALDFGQAPTPARAIQVAN